MVEGEAGDYYYDEESDVFWGRLPTGSICRLDTTQGWKFIQEPDGSISVEPSISQRVEHAGGAEAWHGWLTRGVWRSV